MTAEVREEYETDVGRDHLTLLDDGTHTFPSMLEAIGAARSEIVLEMYWFDSDATGRKFAAALAERARAGVTVRVIYDSLGSLGVDEDMFESMRAAGADVREYHPLGPWRRRYRFGVANNRDHRKILVVDDRIGFTGGINLAHAWAPVSDGGSCWHDDMVRIEGPSAKILRSVFFETWALLGGTVPADVESRRSTPNAPIRILTNNSRKQRNEIRRAYLTEIRSAKRFVYITNSYFVPDLAVRRALRDAVRRGVDVRVLVAGESDVRAVFYATHHLYTRLLKAKIRIFEWTKTVLHSKTAIVDGEWCTIGTFNLDYRSWRSNEEVNAAIRDSGLAGAMRIRFDRDCNESHEVKLSEWRYRSLWERLLEQFYFLFRKLL